MTGKLLCCLLALLLVRCYGFNVPGCMCNFRPISPLFGAKGVRSGVPKFVRVYRKIEGKVEDDPLFPMIEQIARTADLRKATSVKAFRVAHMTELADFVMLIEGTNNRQISAIASSIEEDVEEKFNEKPYGRDGTAASGWFVLDYGLGSVIAHVMTPAMSNFYKLEKKWLDGEPVDLSHIITARPTQNTAAAGDHALSSGEGHMDDWGFTNGEFGGEGGGGGEGEGADLNPFSFDASPSPSHGTSGRAAAHEVPAEDVAFWGEDLAEQLYLEDQEAQREAPLAAASDKMVRKFRSVGSKSTEEDTPRDVEVKAPKTTKGALNKLISLFGKGLGKGLVKKSLGSGDGA